MDDQIGLEGGIAEYIETMVSVFREVKRILRRDGVAFVNIGDSYTSQGGFRDYGSSDNGTGRRFNSGMRLGGDGLKPKDLCLIPERLAIALQADGWYVRSRIAWIKPAPMPESVTDRPTNAWEHIWLLTKSEKYFWDAEAVRERAIHEGRIVEAYRAEAKNLSGATDVNDRRTVAGSGKHDTLVSGRNLRNWWLIGPDPFPDAHFATFPRQLAQRCIMAGTPERGVCSACGTPWQRGQPCPEGYRHNTLGWHPQCSCEAPTRPALVFDPFLGSGTVGQVCEALGRRWVGTELSADYCRMAMKRVAQKGLFA